jgi:hypothetical protein
MALSKAEKASETTDASAPPAPASRSPKPGPDMRAARAAWQTGHHWHSGGSSGGISLVAVSHTSPRGRRLSWPIVRLTWSATWLAMLRAPAFTSQRWKSATGSLFRLDWLRLPGSPRLPDWPLLLGASSRRGWLALGWLALGWLALGWLALGWLALGWLALGWLLGWPPVTGWSLGPGELLPPEELLLPGWPSPGDSDT